MNKLYSLLTYNEDIEHSSSYYIKQSYPAQHTQKSKQICDAILRDIPVSRRLMFICFLCSGVLNTEFGSDIKILDSENTYVGFKREPGRPLDDPELLIYDLTRPIESLKYLYVFLDNDIKQRLVLPEWMDVMAAACLQLLREAY